MSPKPNGEWQTERGLSSSTSNETQTRKNIKVTTTLVCMLKKSLISLFLGLLTSFGLLCALALVYLSGCALLGIPADLGITG